MFLCFEQLVWFQKYLVVVSQCWHHHAMKMYATETK